ncbi:MAG UNVERIFIED_CONTAM: hypothetical protein LVR29_02255 [Microcystis novacekii LVE1205-3]
MRIFYQYRPRFHTETRRAKITVRLPNEFGKPVYEEWYNTNNISVLQLLLAIVSIQFNLNEQLITLCLSA